MSEKKIVINVDDMGNVDAETFGMFGTECIDELDKLMKDIALSGTHKKKAEFYQQKTQANSRAINKHD